MTANHDTSGLTAKQVYTTGEAAEICKISQQTIIRCFDSGRLRGFRVPGSRFRRIPREELVRFMRDNHIPPTELENGKRKVMIVDDDEQIVDLFVDMLTRDGRFEVKVARTGYDAGVLTEQFKPDLMILDFMLPDINGNVVCRSVRQNTTRATIKIILVSGVVNQDDIDDMLSSGAEAFVKKPFNIQDLLHQIEHMLELS